MMFHHYIPRLGKDKELTHVKTGMLSAAVSLSIVVHDSVEVNTASNEVRGASINWFTASLIPATPRCVTVIHVVLTLRDGGSDCKLSSRNSEYLQCYHACKLQLFK